MAAAPGGLLSAPFDENWRSCCEVHSDIEITRWRPVPQVPAVDFRGLEAAMEKRFHLDIVTYYSTYWAGTFEADSAEGRVSLIQLWNQEDFERLRSNLIGHALAKRRRKQPFTIFFATTEADPQLLLSLDCDTGAVMLEDAHRGLIRQVDASLAAFLARLAPATRQAALY